MPEYELRDNLDRLPKVIYFTDSFLALHIDRKGNAFYCIMLWFAAKTIHQFYFFIDRNYFYFILSRLQLHIFPF